MFMSTQFFEIINALLLSGRMLYINWKAKLYHMS